MVRIFQLYLWIQARVAQGEMFSIYHSLCSNNAFNSPLFDTPLSTIFHCQALELMLVLKTRLIYTAAEQKTIKDNKLCSVNEY